MIRVDILDIYDREVKKRYSNTLMRKRKENFIVWENTSEGLPSFAASLQRENDDYFFQINGDTKKNLHVK